LANTRINAVLTPPSTRAQNPTKKAITLNCSFQQTEMPPSTSKVIPQLRLARFPHPSVLSSLRQFTQATTLRYPRKDSQDKDSINTEATEYSKSGTDDQSARNEDAAFNSEITSPEGEKKVAGEGNKVCFLAVIWKVGIERD